MNDKQESTSNRQLGDFIDEYDLRDRNSNVRFDAIVHFNINGKDSYQNSVVRMHMQDGIKTGTIFLETVDQHLFPDYFQARYDVYKFIPDTGLTIENDGKHPRFGKFVVTISSK